MCTTQLHGTYVGSSRDEYVADAPLPWGKYDQRRGRLCSGRRLEGDTCVEKTIFLRLKCWRCSSSVFFMWMTQSFFRVARQMACGEMRFAGPALLWCVEANIKNRWRDRFMGGHHLPTVVGVDGFKALIWCRECAWWATSCPETQGLCVSSRS